MNSRRLLALAASAALMAVMACDDTTKPDPPAPPPQISTSESWTRSNGLPSNDVYDILVTSGGQLWIGTDLGIAVYPTITAHISPEIINEQNGLPNRDVRRMIEYSGKIYVGTWGGGVGIYDIAGDTWTSKGVADGLRASNVADLVVLPAEDRLYCATTNGVSIYNLIANTWASFKPPNLLDPVVSSIQVHDLGGTYERWYGSFYATVITPGPEEADHGITISRGDSTVIPMTLANSGLSDARVNALLFDDDPAFVCWVATTVDGVAKVDPAASTWTYYTDQDGLPSNQVYSVARASGTLWLGTQNGLARRKADGVHWQGYDSGGGLQADRVRRVYSDNGARLWLCFVDGGAARVNPDTAE